MVGLVGTTFGAKRSRIARKRPGPKRIGASEREGDVFRNRKSCSRPSQSSRVC